MSIINSTNLHVRGNRNETTIQPIKMEYVEAEKFDRSKLMELAAAGDIDKVKEYLDKCGITYIIDNKSDPNKTIIMADEIEVYIHKSSSTEETTTTQPNLNTLVNTKIDVWVNDFKTGYTRWGLSSEPTEAQIKTFREALTAACADTSVISDKSDKGVHDWVRGQANIVIAQVKYNAYTERFTDNFTKNFAKYGFDSALTDEELATVKSEFEKLYKAEVKEHVETINKYEGVHQVESIEVWYNELLNKALQQVKTNRAEKTNDSEKVDSTKKDEKTKPANTSTTTVNNKEAYKTMSNVVKHLSTDIPTSVSDIKSFNPVELSKADSNATVIFKILLDSIKYLRDARYDTDYLKNSIGDKALEQLFKIAWTQVTESMNSTNANTKDFVQKVLSGLSTILNGLAENPENLAYYTDTTVDTKDLANYKDNVVIDCRNPRKYDTGEFHLDNDASDKQFQNTMQQLLERIYSKYPNVDKSTLKIIFHQAQQEALSAINGNGINPVANTKNYSISMQNVVDIVLYKFNNILTNKLTNNKTLPKATPSTETKSTAPVSNQTEEQNNNIKESTAIIKDGVLDVADDIVANCSYKINNKRTIHTEFGINKDGKIVFQEQDTTTVYDTILTKLKSKLGRSTYKDALAKLGGEEVLEKLLQSAWINTYNDFNSSTSNALTKFVDKVMNNLEKMLDKLQTNPKLMETFTKRTSYADSTLTNGLKNYNTATTFGNDETVSYAGEVTTHEDGTVHLSQTDDDNDYQTTMNSLLLRVIAKYPEIDKQTVTNVFRNAQREAIKALQQNLYDCPYGTGNGNSRVEDADNQRNWYGKDNRKGDKSKIDLDQLVQMTLYYFDKLLMQELTK